MKPKRLIFCLVLASFIALAAALSVKVAIGVGAWDGVPLLISQIVKVKLGTLQLGMNFLCIFAQFLILKKDFGLRHLLQIPFSMLLGYLVNFFLYDLLANVTLDNYLLRLVLFMLAIAIGAFVIACIMLLDVITFPLEGACMALSRKTRRLRFPHIRQLVDVVCIIICLAVAFLLKLPPVIREGTILGMILFSPIMGFFMKHLKPIFQKYDLAD